MVACCPSSPPPAGMHAWAGFPPASNAAAFSPIPSLPPRSSTGVADGVLLLSVVGQAADRRHTSWSRTQDRIKSRARHWAQCHPCMTHEHVLLYILLPLLRYTPPSTPACSLTGGTLGDLSLSLPLSCSSNQIKPNQNKKKKKLVTLEYNNPDIYSKTYEEWIRRTSTKRSRCRC